MKKRKSVRKKVAVRRKVKASNKLYHSRIFIVTSVSFLGVILILFLLNNILQSSQVQNASYYASEQSVLGEDENKLEDKTKEAVEKAAEAQKRTAEEAAEQSKQDESTPQSPDERSGEVKMTTQNERGKSETEIETADGQKIKTKVEDDGTAKIELEHKNLKIKYEVRNGQVVTRAENQDGEEAKLDEDELEKLEDEVEEELENDGIRISTGSAGQFTFAKNQIAATTNFPLSVDVGTNQLIVTTPAGQKAVAVLPDQAVQNLLATGVINSLDSNTTADTTTPSGSGALNSVIEFKIRNDQPVYEVDGLKTYRLFAFIPVTRPIIAVVSSETGQVLATEKSFLTNIIDVLSP